MNNRDTHKLFNNVLPYPINACIQFNNDNLSWGIQCQIPEDNEPVKLRMFHEI